jgi:hypothetical protein
MATSAGINASSGRRGYLRYLYGNHFWIPELLADFTRGIVRDTTRDAIPANGVYECIDFLLDRPGVAYKRGGCAFQSSQIGAAGSGILVAIAAPEYPGDPRVIAIGSTGATRTLYDVTGGSAGAGISLGTTEPYENPPLYVDKLIITDGRGALPPKKAYLSGGSVAVADLGGSPPNAKVSCVHVSHLVLANSTANPNRIWFSPVPDIEAAWDTANSWFDVPHEVTGLASLQGVLIIFTRGETWRILGDVPPGHPNFNMELQPLATVGCIDARSIVKMNGLVYFAHESGMYYTNGAAPASITHRADATGVGNLWADALAGYSPMLGSVVCAGVYLNKHLFVTVRHADTDPQAGARYQFLYYEPTGSWVELSDGVTATMYATSFAPIVELYAAAGDFADPVRALKMSGLFKPSASNKADANGEAVAPTLTFRTLTDGVGLKAWGRARLTYDMRDAASDNPTLAVAAARGMEATSFATMSTLAESTDTVRQRFSVACDSQAMTIRLTQSNASAMTELHALEVESRPYPRAAEGV